MRECAKYRRIETVCLLFVCIAIFLVLYGQKNVGAGNMPAGVKALSDRWYYMEDGEKVEVALPAVITLDPGDDLTLYSAGLSAEDAGKTVTTRGAVYDLNISVEGETLYQYEDASFPRNVQMSSKVNCAAVLPEDYNGEPLAFTYRNVADGHYEIEEIYAGNADSVLLYYVSRDAFTFLIVFVMAMLGMLSVWVYVYLSHTDVREKRFANIALFLLICVCWFVTDSSLVQTLSGSAPMIRYLSFYAFMLLAVPMLYFVKNTGDMKKYRLIDLCICVFYGNVIVQSVLDYLGIFRFVDMLFVTHLLLVLGILVLVVLLVREYRESKMQELLTILRSFLVVAGGGVLALLLYWTLEISYYEVFFEGGIVVFIILLISSLIQTIVQDVKFRTETVVYQRLAKEDRLTGLGNRRAYDELVEQIQNDTDLCQDIYLIFIDINRLKYTNDMLGHQVGDELIIAAARCIQKAFGQDGSCFRIGGDEFCAILTVDGVDEAVLAARLEAEISLYNKGCSKYQLSVAKGISNLRDDKGSRKTISDWKKEADLKMYADKGWVRRTEM